MSTDLQTYSDELLLRLRMRGVPGPRIAEALAEVRSHVAETGEDPGDAFGPPLAYADELAAALGAPAPVPFWRSVLTWSTAAYAVAGAVGAWLLLDVVTSLATGERAVLGLPPVPLLVLGLVVLGGLAVGLARLARHPDVPVVDPLTGADLTPPLPLWVLPAMVAPPVLSLVLAAVLVLALR